MEHTRHSSQQADHDNPSFHTYDIRNSRVAKNSEDKPKRISKRKKLIIGLMIFFGCLGILILLRFNYINDYNRKLLQERAEQQAFTPTTYETTASSDDTDTLPYYLSPNADSDLGMAFSKDIDSFVLKYNTEIFNIRISSSFSGIDYETIQFLKIDSSSIIGGNDIEQTDMGNYNKSYFYVYDGAISSIAFTVEPLSNDITSVLCVVADYSNQYQIAFAQLVASCILATVTDLSIDDADYLLQKAASAKTEDSSCVPFYKNVAVGYVDIGILISPVSDEVKQTMNYYDIAID